MSNSKPQHKASATKKIYPDDFVKRSTISFNCIMMESNSKIEEPFDSAHTKPSYFRNIT